jgi:hypothetical protein
MNNFVVIDHSVKRIGGHNFEYAFHVLNAAERDGYRPIFAVNRRFFERKRLPSSWTLFTPFQHTAYEASKLELRQKRIDPDDTVLRRATNAPPGSYPNPRGWLVMLPPWLRRRLVLRYEAQKRRIIDRFASDLSDLWEQMRLSAGDQVFVPTLTEDDLLGMVKFLRTHPSAAVVDWHLQFHFKIYEGREPGYASQDERLTHLKQLFQDASTAIGPGSIHYYTTTEHLTAQYNRLGAAEFRSLPYPVNPALLEKPATRRPGAPLRVTCAGGVRAEKGTGLLYRAVAPLWREYFDSGRLQLVVQAKRLGKLPADLRRHARYDAPGRTPREAGRVAVAGPKGSHGGNEPGFRPPRTQTPATPTNVSPPKVAVIRWPLSTETYLDLIRDSDIGLLLYDADQYFVRCSGVMVEMLKAGVPVIVPAGCWMAEQIAESIYAHRDSLCRNTTIAARLTAADVDWEASGAQRYHLWRRDTQLIVGGRAARLNTRLNVPLGATHLCVRFRWAAGTVAGSHLELALAQSPDRNWPADSRREIVGVRKGGASLPIMLPLLQEATSVQLDWRNAFDDRLLTIEELEFVFLSAERTACPLGARGLIAAGVDQAPLLLRDIADHYPHYRRTAEEFAPAWGQWHSPENVVRLLSEAKSGEHATERRDAA